MKKKIWGTAAFCLILLAFGGCQRKETAETAGETTAAQTEAAESSTQETETPVLRIGMMSSNDVIPYVLMEENQLTEKYGFDLDLQVFTSAKDRDAAFQAGELDGVLTDFVGICLYQNGGFDVRITGITDGDYILVAGPDSGITDISQIEGKSVAISENTLIEYALDTILSENGMTEDQVVKEVVPRIPDRLELLRSGQIDFVLLPEPFATLALADGAIQLGTANEYGLYPAVSAFSMEAISENEEAIRQLYKAYNEAVVYMNSTDISEYEDLVIEAVGYPEEMAGTITLKTFRESSLPTEEEVYNAIAWSAAKGLCSADLTYDQLTYDVYTTGE